MPSAPSIGAFQKYLRRDAADKAAAPLGRRVLSTTVPVGARPMLTETSSTRSRLPGGPAMPCSWSSRPPGRAAPARRRCAATNGNRPCGSVQSTRIGLAARGAGRSRWASSLADGRPLPGVTITLAGARAGRTTSDDGLRLSLFPPRRTPSWPARAPTSIRRERVVVGPGGWQRRSAPARCRFDDRTSTGRARRSTSRAGCESWGGAAKRGRLPDGVSS
jgi:hypothetical protein